MSRTVINVRYTCDYRKANTIITDILTSSGYKQIDYMNESVWRNGLGLMTAMKYIKVEFSTDSVTLSGWVCTGIGSISGAEMDLSGIVGALPKKQVISVLDKIKASLS